MKTILLIYMIAINFAGFFLMGADKRRAIRGKWRIRERTFFIIALLMGSLGLLIGMYVFRHKTRHFSFTIGIPTILVIQCLLIALLFSWRAKWMGRPAQAVENELALIEKLDGDTIQSFISYENLINSDLASGSINDETAEAVNLFFQNFKSNIHNEQIDGDEATVSVNITNIDMHALAQDLCRSILKDSVAIYPDTQDSTTSDYYRLLRDTLANNTYEPVVTTAYFHLKKEESGWVILSTPELEDELVSGFISYMNDPKILPASEVLSIHLDAFRDLTGEQWADYLNIDDVFATYNTDFAGQIDQEYVSQLAEYFDYKIIKCSESDNTADAVVRINSIDMTSVLEIYKQHLLQYAATPQSVRDDAVAMSNEIASLLLQSLQENDQVSSTDVELTLYNDGTVWNIQFNSDFSDALMGDMEAAIQTFNSTAASDNVQLIEPRY